MTCRLKKVINKNSFLYKIYKDRCCEYVLDKPLIYQKSFTDKIQPDKKYNVVVHSYGFFILLVALQQNIIKEESINSIVIFDGYFPKLCKFMNIDVEIKIPNIPTLFFFPTVGLRIDYPLESVVRQTIANRYKYNEGENNCVSLDNDNENTIFSNKDIVIIRGLGFGHNILYKSFQEPEAGELIENLLLLLKSGSDLYVIFPNTLPVS